MSSSNLMSGALMEGLAEVLEGLSETPRVPLRFHSQAAFDAASDIADAHDVPLWAYMAGRGDIEAARGLARVIPAFINADEAGRNRIARAVLLARNTPPA